MKVSRYHLLSCVPAILLLAASIFMHSHQAKPIVTTTNAVSVLQSEGLYCQTDNPMGHLGGGFLVSKEPLTWEQTAEIKTTKAYYGMAWVEKCNNEFTTSHPDNALRSGNFFIIGDPELVNRVVIILDKGMPQ